MSIQKVIQSLGLEEKEAKVYLTLLSSGEITATKIAEKTNLDRTLMYQITNKLIEKGLISYFIKNNIRYFSAADPEILLKTLQEKEDALKKTLPELKEMQKLVRSQTKVEIYRGREGINTILKIILKEEKPYFITGGAQEACSIFELENKIFVKQAEKIKIKGKILARKKDIFFVGKNEKYRYIPENLISSTTQMLWSNKTAILVWSEPYYAILIENEEVAKNNLATFNYLWNTAAKPSKRDNMKRLI